jgi:hypothetical protein
LPASQPERQAFAAAHREQYFAAWRKLQLLAAALPMKQDSLSARGLTKQRQIQCRQAVAMSLPAQ